MKRHRVLIVGAGWIGRAQMAVCEPCAERRRRLQAEFSLGQAGVFLEVVEGRGSPPCSLGEAMATLAAASRSGAWTTTTRP